MCGIAGIWAPSASLHALEAELLQAVQRLRHRGPDDSGMWTSHAGLGLGHTRLSILDLSSAGHQPMVSADGDHVIVFNGEIYNFVEIRKSLQQLGHAFSGSGDTEVVLAAFREWGPAAVHRFVGMFALAWWDGRNRTLRLFRDRVGVKPLYFAWDGTTLCFGSELKALRAFGHWRPSINHQALGEFLQYAYISADRTIYEGAYKLLPGHSLTLTEGGRPHVERYWTVTDAITAPLTGTDQDIEEQLEELLISACKYRMVSDVPVGVYLSGGVDSSLVTAILAKHHSQRIRTFTIGSLDDSHDESTFARKVAAHCGTEHTEYIIDAKDGLKLIADWGHLFDEPFGDSSGIPTLLVSKLAREQVKVVLSADGGDELFSGYGWYPTIVERLAQLESLPQPIRKAGGALLRMTPRAPYRFGPIHGVLGKAIRSTGLRLTRLRRILRAPFPTGLLDAYASLWYPEELRSLLGDYNCPPWALQEYPGSTINQMSLRDFHHYLPDDILVKVDRTTMAVGLEGREPLLDHRLANFAFRLPDHLRQGSLGTKHILKRILYRHVPRHLVDRPKRGFSIPLSTWLRTDLRELLHDHMSESRIRAAGIFEPSAVRKTLADFDSGNDYLTYRLQVLLFFEMWREVWG